MDASEAGSGSHFANQAECIAANQMVTDDDIEACLGRVFEFDEIGLAHQLMYENRHPNGSMAVLVGAKRTSPK